MFSRLSKGLHAAVTAAREAHLGGQLEPRKKDPDSCVIATLNAVTLSGSRLATFLDLAEPTNIDVLCVQESRLPPLGFEFAQKAARNKGWHA